MGSAHMGEDTELQPEFRPAQVCAWFCLHGTTVASMVVSLYSWALMHECQSKTQSLWLKKTHLHFHPIPSLSASITSPQNIFILILWPSSPAVPPLAPHLLWFPAYPSTATLFPHSPAASWHSASSSTAGSSGAERAQPSLADPTKTRPAVCSSSPGLEGKSRGSNPNRHPVSNIQAFAPSPQHSSEAATSSTCGCCTPK